MFYIRPAQLEDAAVLLKLSRLVTSNNLPDDPELLREKIVRSRKSFGDDGVEPADREFIFVLEDTDTGHVIGASSIIASLGQPDRPHLFLRVRKRDFYSEDLQTGAVHVTLQLDQEASGMTEIGGLVLSPSFRGHRGKLGSLLSLVRFHFIGLHRSWFTDRIIAEMMGALTPDSRNMLWDYLGRRFINLSYREADKFCRESKEFITALFPKEELYASMLPPEARRLIGRVGPETEPARALLERMGFRYTGHVDPFDGGPYLEAMIDDIELVRESRTARLGGPVADYPEQGIVSTGRNDSFRAIRTHFAIDGETISIPGEAAGLLGVQVGDPLGCTPRKTAGPEPADSLEPVDETKVEAAEGS